MSSAIRFIKTHGLFRAMDALKASPFDTTHVAICEGSIYSVREDDRGRAIFNLVQQWCGLSLGYEIDLCDIHELRNLVEALILIRSIGCNIHDYLDGELANFWMHGLKYSQERIAQAYNLVKAYEAEQ
ncbi:hypothetical protein [Acinetobacter lwoffii]|uniref:hypothetical protein n=1 Tax=Acinetobacter lwoffii TaxID=28090 RepID=UPI00300B31EA